MKELCRVIVKKEDWIEKQLNKLTEDDKQYKFVVKRWTEDIIRNERVTVETINDKNEIEISLFEEQNGDILLECEKRIDIIVKFWGERITKDNVQDFIDEMFTKFLMGELGEVDI